MQLKNKIIRLYLLDDEIQVDEVKNRQGQWPSKNLEVLAVQVQEKKYR